MQNENILKIVLKSFPSFFDNFGGLIVRAPPKINISPMASLFRRSGRYPQNFKRIKHHSIELKIAV